MKLRAIFLPAVATLLVLGGCSNGDVPGFQGYVEGEYLYLAAPQAGFLKSLDVPRGNRVVAGQAVFALAGDPDEQALAEAEAKSGSAREKLANLKAPHRPSEIAALQANLQAAEANLRLAGIQKRQQEALAQKNFVSQARLDEACSAYDQAAAQVDAAKQQIATYSTTLGRQAEVRGPEAELSASQALVAQKRWAVERKTVAAPAVGEIVDTYYRPGEWVPAGAAVASLLPDGRRRLRFFVPESALATLHPGDAIEATCDACPAPIRAKVDFIAAEAEYTPPVIYSRGSREKLVFRVEALPVPEQAASLRPGLPVDVHLAH